MLDAETKRKVGKSLNEMMYVLDDWEKVQNKIWQRGRQ